MEYRKQMEKLLLSGAPAKDVLKSMQALMGLRKAERDFANGVKTLKELLELRCGQLRSGLDRLLEKTEDAADRLLEKAEEAGR